MTSKMTYINNLAIVIDKLPQAHLQLYDIQNNFYEIYLDVRTHFRVNDQTVGVCKNFGTSHVTYLDSKYIGYQTLPIREFLQKFFRNKLTKESVLTIEKYCFEVI